MPRKEITLDDALRQVGELRKVFKTKTEIDLGGICQDEVERDALERLQNAALKLTGTDITPVLERFLQTIPMLPRRYPKISGHDGLNELKKARNLAARLRKLADALEDHWSRETRRRRVYFDGPDSKDRAAVEFEKLPNLLRRYADFRDDMYTRTRKVHYAGRDPQLRAAVYLVNFIKVATNQFHYGELATLLDAAFRAAKKHQSPVWIDRLKVEMSRERARRRKRFRKGPISHTSSR